MDVGESGASQDTIRGHHGSATACLPLTRAEVAPETTWDLADLFVTRDAWLAELAAVERSVQSVVQHQGRLATGPAVLLACLDARDDLLARLDRASTFAGLREAEDGSNPAHQADQSTAAALCARVDAAISFVDGWIVFEGETRCSVGDAALMLDQGLDWIADDAGCWESTHVAAI